MLVALSIMGDLVRVLKKGKLTSEEAQMMNTLDRRMLSSLYSGAFFGGGTALAATWKLRETLRIGLSGGIAIVGAFWILERSCASSLQDILALDGSRLQLEVANIIVSRYQDYPQAMQLLYNHFHMEKVFDDSSMDKSIIRFRNQNVFENGASGDHRRREHVSLSDSNVMTQEGLDSKMKLAPVKPIIDTMEDPLDSIFGYNAPSVEEIAHPGTAGNLARVSTRNHSHRRSHRRRRMQHHEV